MAWRVAKSLLKLRDQINAAAPNRNKDSDGFIGDAAHATRASDHNPWVKDGKTGVVTAGDFTHDPARKVVNREIAQAIIDSGDKRVKYIISNRQIYTPAIAKRWRPYNGTNAHTAHVHISVHPQKSLYDDVRPWTLPKRLVPGPSVPVVPPVVDPPVVPVPSSSNVWPSSGKGSWYSQYDGEYDWVDTGDKPDSNALGVPDSAQGIALWNPPNHVTLGRWYEIKAPNGKVLIAPQTDIGPHPRTGRKIDISAVLAERFGYSPSNFPTDEIFFWRAIEPPAILAGLSKKEQAIKFRDIMRG